MSADVLIHHGIEGQKWGHRNGPPYPLSAQQKKVLNFGEDKKTTSDLTNEELKRYIDRIKLDRELVSLTTNQKERGMKIVGNILQNAGNTVVQRIISETAKYAIDALVKKSIKSAR